VKKVGFASGELSFLRRVLADFDNPPAGMTWPKSDVKTAARILEKLTRAEVPNEPAVNAPAIEEALITYSLGKVAALALPNWQRYARQGAQAGATVAGAQTIGQWMSRQDWMQRGSQTLQSVLNNWSSWLGKAQAAEAGTARPQSGLNGQGGHVGPGPGPQRQVPEGRRPAPGIGRKVPTTH
jgi:hypothetical protein